MACWTFGATFPGLNDGSRLNREVHGRFWKGLRVQSRLATHPALARQKSVDGQIDPAAWGGAPANDAIPNDPEGTFAGGVTSRALEYKSFPFASIGTSLPWLLPSPKST
jgi:hypothetical protein